MLWLQAGFYHRNSIFQRYIDIPLPALLEAGIATPPQLRMVVSETISACIAAANASTSTTSPHISQFSDADISTSAPFDASRSLDADISDAVNADLARSGGADVSSCARNASSGNHADLAAADAMPSRCDVNTAARVQSVWNTLVEGLLACQDLPSFGSRIYLLRLLEHDRQWQSSI